MAQLSAQPVNGHFPSRSEKSEARDAHAFRQKFFQLTINGIHDDSNKCNYTEYRGHGLPPKSLGTVGDVYIDLTPGDQGLFGKYLDEWKKWEGHGKSDLLQHPSHPSRILACSTKNMTYGWITETSAKRPKILGCPSPPSVLAKVLKGKTATRKEILHKIYNTRAPDQTSSSNQTSKNPGESDGKVSDLVELSTGGEATADGPELAPMEDSALQPTNITLQHACQDIQTTERHPLPESNGHGNLRSPRAPRLISRGVIHQSRTDLGKDHGVVPQTTQPLQKIPYDPDTSCPERVAPQITMVRTYVSRTVQTSLYSEGPSESSGSLEPREASRRHQEVIERLEAELEQTRLVQKVTDQEFKQRHGQLESQLKAMEIEAGTYERERELLREELQRRLDSEERSRAEVERLRSLTSLLFEALRDKFPEVALEVTQAMRAQEHGKILSSSPNSEFSSPNQVHKLSDTITILSESLEATLPASAEPATVNVASSTASGNAVASVESDVEMDILDREPPCQSAIEIGEAPEQPSFAPEAPNINETPFSHAFVLSTRETPCQINSSTEEITISASSRTVATGEIDAVMISAAAPLESSLDDMDPARGSAMDIEDTDQVNPVASNRASPSSIPFEHEDYKQYEPLFHSLDELPMEQKLTRNKLLFFYRFFRHGSMCMSCRYIDYPKSGKAVAAFTRNATAKQLIAHLEKDHFVALRRVRRLSEKQAVDVMLSVNRHLAAVVD